MGDVFDPLVRWQMAIEGAVQLVTEGAEDGLWPHQADVLESLRATSAEMLAARTNGYDPDRLARAHALLREAEKTIGALGALAEEEPGVAQRHRARLDPAADLRHRIAAELVEGK